MEGILHDNTIQILNNNVSAEELEMLSVVSLMNSSQNFNVKGLKELLTKLKIKLPSIKLDDYMNNKKTPLSVAPPSYAIGNSNDPKIEVNNLQG